MAPFGKTPTSSNFSDTCIIFTLFIEQCINDTWVRERWELALPIETYMWSSPSYDYMNVYWPHAHRGLIHSSIWSWCDQSSHPLQCLASELFNGFLRPRMFGSKINWDHAMSQRVSSMVCFWNDLMGATTKKHEKRRICFNKSKGGGKSRMRVNGGK
jgi:hypothetical protein